MRWAFWRREAGGPQQSEDAGPSPRPRDWAQLPPIQRAVGPAPETGGGRGFVRDLAGSHPPRLALEPLGHAVSPEAPSGLIGAIQPPEPYASTTQLVAARVRHERRQSWLQRWMGSPAPEPPLAVAPEPGEPAASPGGFDPADAAPADLEMAAPADGGDSAAITVPETETAPAAEPAVRRLQAVTGPVRKPAPPLTVARLETGPPLPRPAAGLPAGRTVETTAAGLAPETAQRSPDLPTAGTAPSDPSPMPGRLTLGQSRRLGLGPPINRPQAAPGPLPIQRSRQAGEEIESRPASPSSPATPSMPGPPTTPASREAAVPQQLVRLLPLKRIGLAESHDVTTSKAAPDDLDPGEEAPARLGEGLPDLPLPLQRAAQPQSADQLVPDRIVSIVEATEHPGPFWTPAPMPPPTRPLAGGTAPIGTPSIALPAATGPSVQRAAAGQPLIRTGGPPAPELGSGALPPATRASLPAPLEEMHAAGEEPWSGPAPRATPMQRVEPIEPQMDRVLRLPVVQPLAAAPIPLTRSTAEPSTPLPLAAPVLQREVAVETRTAVPALQRQPDPAAPALEAIAPVAEASPAVQRQEAGGAPASPTGAAAGGHSEKELDDLARQLYDRFRVHFRSELLIDRERVGMLVDRS